MKIYRAGNVILANYVNFKGEIKKGIFMVLYDEAFDNNIKDGYNVIAIKITTQQSMLNNYVCDLNKEVNSFFDKDCLASCSKIHTLNKNQIEGYLGYLNKETFTKVYGTFRKVLNEIDRQMVDDLM